MMGDGRTRYEQATKDWMSVRDKLSTEQTGVPDESESTVTENEVILRDSEETDLAWYKWVGSKMHRAWALGEKQLVRGVDIGAPPRRKKPDDDEKKKPRK